jgi:hypothetical protein
MVASGHKNSRIAHTVACAAGGGRNRNARAMKSCTGCGGDCCPTCTYAPKPILSVRPFPLAYTVLFMPVPVVCAESPVAHPLLWLRGECFRDGAPGPCCCLPPTQASSDP